MNNTIRILHILESLDIGGLENGVVNLANNLDPSRFKTIICCVRREGLLKSRLKPHVKVFCLKEKPGFNPLTAITVARLCHKERITVMHTHGWAGGLFCGTLGAYISRVPVILNGEHGVFYIDKSRRRIAQKFLFALTQKIIPVSFDLKDDLIRYFGIKPTNIIPIVNGVDMEKFKPDKQARRLRRKELGLSDTDIVIGSVGRLVPIKDYPTLLRAAERVMREQPSIKLVLIGDGEQRDELHKITISLGIESNIVFLGARNDVHELMNMFDLFALSSIDEGLSNVILEAMSTGIPVVATAVGDNPSIIRDGMTGVLVQVGNVEALATAIRRCINPLNAMQMGGAGRKRIEEHFSLERMIENYENLYIKSVSESRKRYV